MHSFIPPAVTNFMNSLISNLIGFFVILICGAFVAMLLARRFGGKSKDMRMVIFQVVSFIGACIGGYIFLLPHAVQPPSPAIAKASPPKQQAPVPVEATKIEPHYEKVFVKGKTVEECRRADGVIDHAVALCLNDHYEKRLVN